jgi:heterodisulfide reductase subunit B2
MPVKDLQAISYFPGCSLASASKGKIDPLHTFALRHDVALIGLDDWNCCGSSSTHSIDHSLSELLPTRNLALAPAGRPLIAPCPNCHMRLKLAHLKLQQNEEFRTEYERMWNRDFDNDLEIITFFELVWDLVKKGAFGSNQPGLKGLKVAAYYGCMLSRPPVMRQEKNHYGLIEKVLLSLGAEPVSWLNSTRCCGTFLTASRPDIATRTVADIMASAKRSGADCIVTACVMCQMNLEIRSDLSEKIPIFRFSELLELSMGTVGDTEWLNSHLIDPRPLIQRKQLMG